MNEITRKLAEAQEIVGRPPLPRIEITDHTEGRPVKEVVNHPSHYGGGENPYEHIKVAEAWGLGYCLGNATKYICRAGKKDGATDLVDLRKALWYLQREITNRERNQ